MLAGRPPFRGEKDEIARAHIEKTPIPIDTPLWPAIAKLLEKKRDRRPDSCEEVRRMLREYVAGSEVARAIPHLMDTV